MWSTCSSSVSLFGSCSDSVVKAPILWARRSTTTSTVLLRVCWKTGNSIKSSTACGVGRCLQTSQAHDLRVHFFPLRMSVQKLIKWQNLSFYWRFRTFIIERFKVSRQMTLPPLEPGCDFCLLNGRLVGG